MAASAVPFGSGRALYAEHCARCHGESGTGDGPDAALFSVPPPDLRRGGFAASPEATGWVAWIREGRRAVLEVRPAALARAAEETEAVARFLERLVELPREAARRGALLYADRCAPCHGADGRPTAEVAGGVGRPSAHLAEVAAALDDAELRGRIRHRDPAVPALVPAVSEGEARDLAVHVSTLSEGGVLWERWCASCHGLVGEGAGADAGPELPRVAIDGELLRARGPVELRRQVWHRLERAKPSMPHFAATLTSGQARAILGYLRSLPRLPADRSGTALQGAAPPP